MAIFFYRLSYFVREALKNIRHAAFLTGVSVATIAVSLVLVGAFSFLLLNANRFLDQIAQDLRVSAYLTPDAGPEAIDALVGQLRERKEVGQRPPRHARRGPRAQPAPAVLRAARWARRGEHPGSGEPGDRPQEAPPAQT